jgi:hypothetical protein
MLNKDWMIASWIASHVRALTRPKMVFSLEHASSIEEEIGRIRRQEQELVAPNCDGLFDLGPLMDRQIVQGHDLGLRSA